jgi:tetratricopeptide (TPR) repeat protein
MNTGIKRIWVVFAAAVVFSAAAEADTYRLDRDGQLRAIDNNDMFALAAANIKTLGEEGKTKELKEALKDLKTNFPQIAGAEFNAFAEAELLFAAGKFEKAFLSYEKFLNRFSESRFYQAALDREFAIGTAYLQGRKKKVLGILRLSGFDEGAKVMEKIADRAGDLPIAIKALVSVAQTYEKKEMFEEAYQQWSLVSGRWPSGAAAKDALVGMARCQHAIYRGPSYDSSCLLSAKGYYERFKLIYPEDAKNLNIDQRLRLIDEQLAYKKFNIGKYYQRTQDKKSAGQQVSPASLYFDMVAKNWPDSTAAKLAKDAAEKNEKEKIEEGK